MFPKTFLLVVYTVHIKFYFSGKDKEKVPNIQVKYVIENLFLLFKIIVREHLGTQDMCARKAREHISTQDMLAREHESTQGMLAREHVRHAI